MPTPDSSGSTRSSKLGARRISPVQETHPDPRPAGLSDKAKGKRRAYIDDNDDADAAQGPPEAANRIDREDGDDIRIDIGDEESEQERGRSVTFRFTGQGVDQADLDVWVDPGESVGRVKDKIKSLRPELQSHPLKFIHSGRLLTDGILLLPYVQTLEERHRNARSAGVGMGLGEVVRDVTAGVTGEKREMRKTSEEKVWMHCVVGAPLSARQDQPPREHEVDDEESEGSEQADPAETAAVRPPRRGFDALLDAGLSAAEVAHMRRQFYAGRGEEVPEGLDQDDEHTRALEEQWIEGDLTQETATTVAEGLYTSILTGIIIGFLYPILPWFLFREVPAPNFFEPYDMEPDRQALYGSADPSSTIPHHHHHPTDEAQGTTTSATTTTTTTTTGTGTRNPLGVPSSSSPLDMLIHGVEGDPALPNTTTTPTPGSRLAGLTHTSGAAATIIDNLATGSTSGLFGIRGRPGGEWITGVAFGPRVQMAILMGTILNMAYGACRMLV